MYREWEDRQDATRGHFWSDPDSAGREAVLDYLGELADHDGDEEDDDVVFDFPMKKEICAGCDGEGQIPFGQHMSFTSSEFNETFDDEESRHNYFSGRYDKTCPDCKGEKIIKSVDTERFKTETPDLYKIYKQAVRECRQSNAESLAEFRMGC